MMSSKYAPPWFDAETGQFYGPETVTTYAKHVAKFRDWAYQKPGPERAEAPLVHCYAMAHHGQLSESLLSTYRMIYVHRMSLREAAEECGLSRSTVRSYVVRLRERAEKWQTELDTNREMADK